MAIKLIMGLRNPGSAYEQTRHNAGGWFALALVQRHSSQFKLEKKLQTELADLNLAQETAKVALPLTFMNHSGQVTRAITQFYRIAPEEVLVVHDELDLPVGCIRLKSGGGHGGHNGLRDIVTQLGSSEFHRLRIGIGHPGHKDLVHQYVLNKPSLQDRVQILDAIERGIAVMPLVLSGELPKAMNQLNT
ncbi:MAG: aminoacyl-tRNA hydrolase [Legionellales bacterium]